MTGVWCLLGVKSRVEKEGREVVRMYKLGGAVGSGHLVTMSKSISNNNYD